MGNWFVIGTKSFKSGRGKLFRASGFGEPEVPKSVALSGHKLMKAKAQLLTSQYWLNCPAGLAAQSLILWWLHQINFYLACFIRIYLPNSCDGSEREFVRDSCAWSIICLTVWHQSANPVKLSVSLLVYYPNQTIPNRFFRLLVYTIFDNRKNALWSVWSCWTLNIIGEQG